jgi:uncharacterized protein YecT (DUF1311 family)
VSNSKRNHALAEIQRRQGPLPSVADLIGATFEIELLDYSLRHPAEGAPTLRKLVPIRVVACIESCLKAATAELINYGEPYRGNARKLFQHVRIDFDVLTILLDDRVSVGEIVAHSLGWHDMGEINARMTTILGFGFFDRLKIVEDRWEIELKKGQKKPIIDSLDNVLADINDALRLRHVLCHETANFAQVSEDDVHRFVNSGSQFTDAVSEVISETLHPNAPLTQTDMNIDAGKRAAAAEEQLDRELAKLAEKLDAGDKEMLRASQEAWKAYKRAFAELESNAAKGGTMQSMLYGNIAEAITRNRILEIQESLRQEGLAGKAKRRRSPK